MVIVEGMDLHASAVPTLPGSARLGFYSDEQSLALVAPFADRHDAPVLVRSKSAHQSIAGLRSRGHASPLVADGAAWRGGFATAGQPTALANTGTLFGTDLDTWGDGVLASSGASAVLTPSLFVRGGDWAAMRALVSDLVTLSRPGVVPFIPTSGSMLEGAMAAALRRHLAPLAGSPVALLFAGGRDLFEGATAIASLRELMDDLPGAWVVGVDALVGTDVLARGAAPFVGVRSGLRWPAEPGAKNMGFAVGFMPGLFNRDLLAMRTPSVYADWYVNSASPTCPTCRRSVDGYSASEVDKAAILDHNLHAFHSFAEDLLAHSPARRAAWLHTERVAAFEAHFRLSRTGRTLAADGTLRRFCEIDDPAQRATTPAGSWR